MTTFDVSVLLENILGAQLLGAGMKNRTRMNIKPALPHNESLVLGITQMNFGVVRSLLGDYDGALSYFHRARSHFEEAGDLARLAELHYKCGMTFLAKRAEYEALPQFERVGLLSAKINNQKLTSLAKLGKAYVYYQLADWRAAFSLANQSLESLSVYDDRPNLADVYLLKGKIHREMKKFELAEWYFQASLKINLGIEKQIGVAECGFQLGTLFKQRGNVAEARRAFTKSIECFKSIGAIHDVKRVELELCKTGGKSENETRGTRQPKP